MTSESKIGSAVSWIWKVRVNSSPLLIGQMVRSQPVDEPVLELSTNSPGAQLNPVPEISVVHGPSGHPLNQQHSEKPVLIAM